MSENVRRFLERMAGEARVPGDVPPGLSGRSARRRARTLVVGAAAMALLGYGGFAGVGALTNNKQPVMTPLGTLPCTWNVVGSPNHDPERFDNSLQDISVVSDDDAWAVGSYYERHESGFEAPLLLHWDGSAWSESDVPAMDGRPYVQGVAAISSDDVWAVGYREGVGPNTEGPVPIALHWDGSAWSMIPVDDPGTRYSGFTAVAGTSSDDVWAVGFTATGEEGGTLAEHWDGSSWTVVDTPSPPPDPLTSLPYPRLDAVTTLEPDDVWAVGSRENIAPTKGSNTLVLHWDGEHWTVIPSPDVLAKIGPPVSQLVSVSATSPRDVWAAGTYAVNGNADQILEHVLVEHWDGRVWSTVETPPLYRRNWVAEVVAISPQSVWVLSGRYVEGGSFSFLVELWDGESWTVAEPDVAGSADVSAAAASPSGDLWAVGNRSDEKGMRTLVLRCS